MPRMRTLSQLWQRLKHKKTIAGSTQKIVPKNNGKVVPDTPPPPYDDPSTQSCHEDALGDQLNPYPVLKRNAEYSSSLRLGRLQWILCEIIAATFSTDIGSLKKAMANTDPVDFPEEFFRCRPSSIWCKTGRRLIAETCALVCNLEQEMAQSRWLLVHPRDKYLVERTVLIPAQEFGMDVDFVLELLGRYKRGPECSKPESTLLTHWMKSPHSTDLGDAIASHSLLLEKCVLEDEVRVVLQDSIAAFQKREGLEAVCTSRELQEESLAPGATCCWPLSDGYVNLARGLRALKPAYAINDPYESSRARLKERRDVQSKKA